MFESRAVAGGGRAPDPPWMAGLNDAQREAVTAPGGPLLVVAGAGTGKTTTLACRVAWLVDSGVAPERILLLTFTRRAAQEMLARAERMTGRDVRGRVWGGTFHAVGNRLLRLHGTAIGLRPDFTILDQGDAADLLGLIRGDLGPASGERRFPGKDTLAAIYSRTVNARRPLGDVLGRAFPWCLEEAGGIREVFRAYTERKRRHNVLDYDDLLLYWNGLVAAPGVGEEIGRRFDHVLVDEYQDTNALQAEILLALRRVHPSITVVGDDAQAIYGFRSATVRNILDFPSRFPGTRTVTLEQSYRSTPPVLACSNAVIALAPERHEKRLWSAREGVRRPRLVTCLDEAGQSEAVCQRILEHREEGVDLQRQAVLFRAAHHSAHLEVELALRNIPFVKYGGLRFLEAGHVKDVLALLRILENPLDAVSWFRVLQLLEGVGPAAARSAMAGLGLAPAAPTGAAPDRPADASAAVDPGSPPSPLARFLEAPPRMPSSAARDLQALRAALADCVGRPDEAPPVASQIERVLRFLDPVVHRRYTSPVSRLRDVEHLARMASAAPSRSRFLAELTLDPPASTGDLAGPPLLDEDYVILSTIHSAKGCEWDVVHVIHAADGMIPSDLATGDAEEIEEERRLLYVALTRARDALHVYFPLRYHHRKHQLGDRHGYAQLTRFLPPSVRSAFDEEARGTPEPDDGPPATAGPGAAALEVDRLLAELWDA